MMKPHSELGNAARGGAVTLVGSISSAALGFLLSVVLARLLGTGGSGVVLQAIAFFTIVLAVSRLGLDTTAVWMLPRLLHDERSQVRGGVVALLVPALVAPLLVVGVWFLLVATSEGPLLSTEVDRAVSFVVVFVPAAATMTVALAATRAFGGVLPFNLIGNVGVPALRVIGVATAIGLGGGTAAAAVGWAAPWFVGTLLSVWVLGRQLRSLEPSTWRPARPLAARVVRFTGPRAVASGLEQSIIWLDVILVGLIAGAAAAGTYGIAARFVGAGVVVATALRIVVAPRFSTLLGQDRVAEVGELYAVTARWILLFGSPVYLVLAVFSPTVLGWLGGDFSEGAAAMTILCLGSVALLAAGNVQSLLLMSGRSGWAAFNKLVVLGLNVVGNLILIPILGIEGAAITWVASMVVDTSLAVLQVRRATGLSLDPYGIGAVLLGVVLVVGGPCVVVAQLMGQGTWSLVVGVVVSGGALLGAAVLARGFLHVEELRAVIGSRRAS
ncbi:MAG: polysaccharide biosynthesis C-terminal domain-containing protein [Ornithinimicrobium sp.]